MDNVVASLWYVIQIGTANFVVVDSHHDLTCVQRITFNGLVFERGQFRVLYSGDYATAMQYLNDVTE